DHPPAPGVEHVDAAHAARRVEPRRVVMEAGQDLRGADEGQVAVEAESPRPARQARDGDDPIVLHHAHLAVAAVVDPEPAVVQPRRAATREPAAPPRPRTPVSPVVPEKITPRPSTAKFRCPGRRTDGASVEAEKYDPSSVGPAAIELSWRGLRAKSGPSRVSTQRGHHTRSEPPSGRMRTNASCPTAV